MSDDNVLTKEIAEQFLADNNSVDLSEFTAIEDEAAEILSKHDDRLNLTGLTSLSDEAARALSGHRSDLKLDLNWFSLQNQEGVWPDGIRDLLGSKGNLMGDPRLGYVSGLQVSVWCGTCGRCEMIDVDLDLGGDWHGDPRPSLERKGWKALRDGDPIYRCQSCVVDELCPSCGEGTLVSILGLESPLCMDCDGIQLEELLFSC